MRESMCDAMKQKQRKTGGYESCKKRENFEKSKGAPMRPDRLRWSLIKRGTNVDMKRDSLWPARKPASATNR